MSVFQLSARRKRQTSFPAAPPSNPVSSSGANPFSDDVSDDDDAENPRPTSRQVTSISNSSVQLRPATPALSSRPSPTPPSQPTTSHPAEKPSQIARLLARRNAVGDDALDTSTSRTRDDALFHAQLSQCADDNDATYVSTPVAGFGEAMLRSMGWSGKLDTKPVVTDKDVIVPRPNRLGLGAKFSDAPPPSRKRRKIDVRSRTPTVPKSDAQNVSPTTDGVTASSDAKPRETPQQTGNLATNTTPPPRSSSHGPSSRED